MTDKIQIFSKRDRKVYKGFAKFAKSQKKKCKHRWRIGSWNAYLIKGKIRKRSLNIWCEKCRSKHKAWLK